MTAAPRLCRRLGLPSIAALCLLTLALAGCSTGNITAPRYVLSYGISDYPGEDNDLDTPAIDAETMRDLLVSYGYSDRVMRQNGDVIKSNIRDDILGLSSLEKDSVIVIFYSGHGTYNMYSDTSYLVPYDSAYISPAELSSWIAQTGQRNVIVIIHACYSGGFIDPGSAIDVAPQNYGPNDWGTTPIGLWSAIGKFGELLTKNAESSGTPDPIVISAAGSNESAWESSLISDEHAVFPYFIFEAAQNGDKNGDGFVTATEAYSYAASSIKLNWNLYVQDYYEPSENPPDPNQGYIYIYPDFMPHISGGSRDLVLFGN